MENMTNAEENARYDRDFRAIIDADDTHDIGLEKFDRRMHSLENSINKPESTVEEEGYAVESLNYDWPYHDETATITGRVYIAGEETEEIVPESWGEPIEDNNGARSYLVEDIAMQSMGIIAGFDNGRARLAYAFCFPQEDPSWPDFIMYPGEGVQHYSLPTELAISARLHRRWPDKMESVDNLIQPHVDEKMIRRMKAVARRLQPELNDEAFRELIIPYLNYRLDFDQKWPYIVQVDHDILCFDTDEELKEGKLADSPWVVMNLDSPLTLAIRRPAIDFVPYEGLDDDYVHPVLFCEISDPDSEEEGAQIMIPLEHISRLVGTRVSRSMVERALMGYEIDNNLTETVSQLQTADSVGVRLASMGIENSHKPPKVVAMEFLERDIVDFIASIKAPMSALYDTEEQAQEVATNLSNESGNRLVGSGIAEYILAVSGERTMRPRTVNKLPKDFVIEPGTFVLQVDPEMPLVPLNHGDTINGTAEMFLGVAEPEYGEEGEVIGYRAVPSLIIDISQETKSLLNFGSSDAPLVEVAAQRRAAIPLDGSVEIRIVSLEKYRDNVRVLKAAKTQYRNDPVVKLLNDISEALFSETGQFQEFKQVKKLRRVAQRIESDDLPGGKKRAIEVLEAMFLKRHIRAFGAVIFPNDLATIHSSAEISGLVADIRDDIDGVDGLTLVISSSDHSDRYYVPISRLTHFAF